MNKLINDEKHYVTLNNYLKDIYHQKVFKVSLNGDFSCPNRDGKISYEGCIFCSEAGSGDFAGEKKLSIKEQFNTVVNRMHQKWKEGYYIAYFQANTNTYDTLENLKKRYNQIIDDNYILDEKIKILSIATRPDCLTEEIVQYLSKLNQKITIWVELGFQTMHQQTALLINRGYLNDTFIKAVKLLNKYQLKIIVHIINGLPGETANDMIETAKFLNKLKIDGVKIHMLHILKNTPLEILYQKSFFHLLSLEEYVQITVNQLRYLNDKIVIHRITGDAPKDLLIEPLWTLKKFVVINEIDKLMRSKRIYQGDLCIK